MKLRLALLSALLLVAPAFAGTDAIAPGTDLWHTPGDGSTYVDFGRNPLPADFFCLGSEPFAGRVVLQGAPLAVKGARLGNADTLVERLDTARFDEYGFANTRVRMTALSLVSVDTIETACGSYTVKASLVGEQPATTMRIYRTGEGGGYFLSGLSLISRVVFEPTNGNANRPRELTWNIQSIETRHPWATQTGPRGITAATAFEADTNGDGRPDRRVLGSSTGFAPGWVSYIDAKTGELRTEVTVDAAISFTPDDTICFDCDTHAVTPPTDDGG